MRHKIIAFKRKILFQQTTSSQNRGTFRHVLNAVRLKGHTPRSYRGGLILPLKIEIEHLGLVESRLVDDPIISV